MPLKEMWNKNDMGKPLYEGKRNAVETVARKARARRSASVMRDDTMRVGRSREILNPSHSKPDRRIVGRLRRRVGDFAFLFAIVFLAARGETVALTEDFESPNAFSRWHSDGGFSVVEGTGVAGSHGLVWEQSRFRPMKMVTPPVVEGNVVRPVPRAVPERLSKGVVLEPGRVYSFSVKINGAITNNCAYVFLAWYDCDGKRIGRADGRPTIYKDAGRKGWETVSAATPRLPSDVVRGEIMVELYRTTLGRMAFDDFTITCDEPCHVERMFSSAYRDTADADLVRFVVPYIVSPEKFPKDGLSGEFTFSGVDGKTFSVPADVFADDHFEVSLDVSRLAPGKHPVKAKLLFKGKELGVASLDFTRGRVERAVSFDKQQRMIVDGKPFFALGVYVHPADKEVPYLDRLKNSPFNCVIECAADKRMLDKFHAAGLKVIPRSPRNHAWAGSTAKSLRSHPALLAWYVIDEAPADRADDRRGLYKVLNDADPDHPTFAVLALPRTADAFMGAFDIISSDPYPIGVGRGQISIASEYPRICREKTWGLRPLWQVPQSFAWDWCLSHKDPEGNRYPTYEELRSMAWQAIAGGANGLLWYSAHHIFKCSSPEELETNWGNLVRVAEEIKSYADVIQSEDVSTTSSNPSIVVRAFRKDGATWVLAANSVRTEASGVVEVSGLRRDKVSLPPLGIEFHKHD